MDVDNAIAGRRNRGVSAVDDEALAFPGPEVETLERVLVPDKRARLDDRRATVEVQDVAGAIEARRRIEDVVALVLHERFEAGAVEIDRVEIRAESGPLIRLLREREHDRLAGRVQYRCRRGALRREVDDPAAGGPGAIEGEQTGGGGAEERGLEADAQGRPRRARRGGARRRPPAAAG